MRSLRVGACFVWLLGLTACPHAFGREGTIDRAVHKDAEENLARPDCTKEVYDALCGEGKDTTKECLEICG
ncbi:hypothetical protein [Hyalangium gracile]|uniref:hypothetical protein n=1 Tax=Hyalangium gracile TaxID=394092 RepID=UPI001CCE4EC9|nr:hypothetical protein [Hyalangium gracile]